MKVALHYSQVEELEVAFLRDIYDWLLRFKQKTEKAVLNKTTERRGVQRFLLQMVSCENTSIIEGVVDKGIDTLRAILNRIGIHTTEH